MRLTKLVIVFSMGLALAGAHAQSIPIPIGPDGGYGSGGGGLIVARRDGGVSVVRMVSISEGLQKELKLDKDAIEKVKLAMTKVDEDIKEDIARLRDRQSKLTQEERDELNKKINDAYDKGIGAVLTAEQMKRVHQIENQRLGLAVFQKDDVKKALKLTDEQQDDIKDIMDELDKDSKELSRPGKDGRPDLEAPKKLQNLRKDAKDRITKLLSDSQNKALKDLVGAPFDMAQLQQGGGVNFATFMQIAGQILSQVQKDRLELTDDQKKEIEELQKEVDAKLGKILTDKQKKKLDELKQNPFGGIGPGGPGGAKPLPVDPGGQ